MYPFKDYLTHILEAKNWNFDYYHHLILEYGPIILLTAITLILGKYFGGKIRLKWSEFYKRKGISNVWSNFLARTNHIKFKETWKNYFSDSATKRFFITSIIFGTILGLMSAKFIAYNSDTPGRILYDPMMTFLAVKDWSPFIFFLEYFAVILMIFHLIDRPAYFIKCFWAVASLQIVRAVFIKMIPLSAPSDMIYLTDPFTQFFFGENIQVTNDLFFSGHVSLLALFFFMAQSRFIKIYLFFASLFVAIMLVWQHVHYSYDVLFAPVASYGIYRLIIIPNWGEQIIEKYKSFANLD